jgi:hypothetical protein
MVTYFCTVSAYADILLEDFATPIRQASEGDLLATYNGEDPGQTYSFANNMMQVNGAPANCGGSDCGIYWHFLPYPYIAPKGFASGWIKNGTWDPDVNHLRFSFMCTKSVPKDSSGYGNIQVGTYIKPTSDTQPSNQGAHYYHHLDPNVYPNQWVYVDINRHPQHQVGMDSNTNWPDDPMSSQVHYFDGLTRFYFDTQGGSWAGQTCYFRNLRFAKVSGEPDYEVSSITATYNGNAYEVVWAGLKNSSLKYDIYFSTTSMKTGGVGTEISGGTIPSTGNAYTDVLWKSPSMPESPTGLYVAIKPQGYSNFTEIYIPNSTGSSDTTPPAAPNRLRLK